MFKLSNYVKLPAWLQFVGSFIMLGSLLGILRGHPLAHTVGLLSLAVAAGVFIYRQKSGELDGYDKQLRELLQAAGFALDGIGLGLLFIPYLPAVWVVFLGVGMGFAGLFYEVIYP